MYKGMYKGKILRINLIEQSVVEKEVSDELVKNYSGGAEFEIENVHDEVNVKTPPLSPDKKLIFRVGPNGLRDGLLPSHVVRVQVTANLETMLDDYYHARACDEEGNQGKNKLEELGIKI